jgi:hypothetical protein
MHYWDDQTKENEVSGICSTRKEDYRCTYICTKLIQKLYGKRRNLEDNIKVENRTRGYKLHFLQQSEQ